MRQESFYIYFLRGRTFVSTSARRGSLLISVSANFRCFCVVVVICSCFSLTFRCGDRYLQGTYLVIVLNDDDDNDDYDNDGDDMITMT